jgi:putative acyl-CoA dehydrogenase
VWEGTANMMCMDVRRAMLKDPRTIEALIEELRPLKGRDPRFDAFVAATERLVREGVNDEFLVRPMTEAVARALQGAELMRYASEDVVEAFLGKRCAGGGGAWGVMFGTIGLGLDKRAVDRIVERAGVMR